MNQVPKMDVSSPVPVENTEGIPANSPSISRNEPLPPYLASGLANGDNHVDTPFNSDNCIPSSPSIIRPFEKGLMNDEVESDKPFNISDFKGPDLSEEDSDGELPDPKRLKTLESSVDLFDNGLDNDHDKGFSLSSLNGNENYLEDNIPSPDIQNYAHLLDGMPCF